MQCPRCHSRSTKTCEVSYAIGSRWGRYQTMNEFAALCAPPYKREYLGILSSLFLSIWCMVFIAFLASHALRYEDFAQPGQTLLDYCLELFEFTRWVWFGIFIYVLIRSVSAYLYNRYRYPQEYKQWQAQWVCMQCAFIFEPKNYFASK